MHIWHWPYEPVIPDSGRDASTTAMPVLMLLRDEHKKILLSCYSRLKQKQWDSAYLCQGTSYLDPYLYPDLWFVLPPKFSHLFTGPLPTFPENFVQIRSEVLLRKVANRQTNRQTDKQTTRITYLLGGGRNRKRKTKQTSMGPGSTGHVVQGKRSKGSVNYKLQVRQTRLSLEFNVL